MLRISTLALLNILILLLAQPSQAQVNLNQGLMAHWDFNGNALDKSPYANHGAVFGAVPSPGKLGAPNTAYKFNGASFFIEVAHSNSLTFNSIFTIHTVIKPEGFSWAYCHGNAIISKGNSFKVPGNYSLLYSDAIFLNGANCNLGQAVDVEHQNFYIQRVENSSPSTPDTPYIDQLFNTWYTVTGVSDGLNFKMYIDGNLSITMPASIITGTSNTDKLYIGRRLNNYGPFWLKATIDDIRMYNRALNQQEIDSLHTISQQFPVGVNNYTKGRKKIVLSPNPAVDVLQAKVQDLKGNGRLVFTSMEGREVLSVEIRNTEMKNIDISKLASGIYTVHMDNDRQYAVSKIVKN